MAYGAQAPHCSRQTGDLKVQSTGRADGRWCLVHAPEGGPAAPRLALDVDGGVHEVADDADRLVVDPRVLRAQHLDQRRQRPALPRSGSCSPRS